LFLKVNEPQNQSRSFTKPTPVAPPPAKKPAINGGAKKSVTEKISNLEPNLNYSPIKTRFNLRLLESVKQEHESLRASSKSELKDNRNGEEEVKKRVRRSDSRHENETRKQISDEPKLKKTKSLKFLKSSSEENASKITQPVTAQFLKTSPVSNGVKNNMSISPIFSAASALNKSGASNLNGSITGGGGEKLTSPKSSFISNAIFTTAPSANASPKSSVVVSNGTNPIGWTTQEVCKYVVDNKFDPQLAQLIQDQVRFKFWENLKPK
jgi:hypothetical protein